ncbi:NADH-quinone oxidoreductase subunit NuoG [Candidatus Poriferisodalis sp.]|uniref:NADH-quinone oxidoreductase subunit NuoG n=1 Tax=Candidatus Poriferisodalis sp. TaxID=3101277 RepID=UPI003B013AA9
MSDATAAKAAPSTAASNAAASDAVEVTIDGVEVDARPGELVIAAAERAGVHIPRFCYHERMSSVGMCRMCLVEIDTGRGPQLQASCMVPVSPQMVVDTASERTQRAQEGVLEMLLINHPLDCPVCDKGGECPLQDQTMAYGPGESRFVEEKRHFEKPIPISELVHLDRERCILCDRCTRFADEIAGDPLIDFVERGNETQVLTFPGEPFSSYFSGNTVQICPVGALTAAPYRFKARPWDLAQTESTCTTCAVGCRIAVQSSRNELVRCLGVDIDPVNHGWLCDKGRFAYGSVSSPERVTRPLRARSGGRAADIADVESMRNFEPSDWAGALDAVASAVKAARPGAIAVLGGARGTNEDAYAWSKLARTVLRTNHVDAQMGDGLAAELVVGLGTATIDDACNADTTLLVCGDLREELPVLQLRLRGAARAGTTRLVEISPVKTGLSGDAARSERCRGGEAASVLRDLLNGDDPLGDELAGGSVVVVLGRSSVAESADAAAEVASVIADRVPHAKFLVAARRGNVRGALDMGLAPGLLPGRSLSTDPTPGLVAAWGELPAELGCEAAGILTAAAAGDIDVLFLLGADPVTDFPDSVLARLGMAGARTVVAVDTFLNQSTIEADIILPASAFGEKSGTTTNIEGRVSALSELVTPPGSARPDWMIAAELAMLCDADLGFVSASEITAEIAVVCETHADVAGPGIEGDGVLVRGATFEPELPPAHAAPPRDAYSLRLVCNRKLYDGGVTVGMTPALASLRAETALRVHPTDLERVGVESGTEVEVHSERGALRLPIVADAAVGRHNAVLLLPSPALDVGALIDATAAVTDVRIETRVGKEPAS